MRLWRDKSTRQKLELEAAVSELKQLDEIKSRFISVVAHELRTPLAAISGYVEVLLDDEEFNSLAQKRRDYLQIVQNSTNRMLKIVSNLLDVNRIEAGRIELVLRPIDLPTLVQSKAAECKPQLEAKTTRLTVRTAPDLPLALCDEGPRQADHR